MGKNIHMHESEVEISSALESASSRKTAWKNGDCHPNRWGNDITNSHWNCNGSLRNWRFFLCYKHWVIPIPSIPFSMSDSSAVSFFHAQELDHPGKQPPAPIVYHTSSFITLDFKRAKAIEILKQTVSQSVYHYFSWFNTTTHMLLLKHPSSHA